MLVFESELIRFRWSAQGPQGQNEEDFSGRKEKYMRISRRKTMELYLLGLEKEVKVTGTRTRARKVMRK